jgi:hypothetical protein
MRLCSGKIDKNLRRFISILFTFGVVGGAAVGASIAAEPALAAAKPGPGMAHSAKPAPPKTVYAVTFAANSTLYSLSPGSHKASRKGHAGVELTDIAFRGKTLYAISFTDLYWLNTATGASHHIGSLGGGITSANALATQPKTNILYGADQFGDVFKINQKTGRVTIIGSFGGKLGSAGDLTFAGGHLYALVFKASTGDTYLATVNLHTGAAKIVGNTGFKNVWGLVTGTGALYGATQGGLFLVISPVTGHAKAIWKEKLAIGGLATP